MTMNRTGITLVELLIVIAIIGIIIMFATIDTAWFQREGRVTEARDRLLADIEEAKLKSLAQVPHGIVIDGASSYKMVKLNDKGKCSLTPSTACLQDSDCGGGETCDLSYRNFKKDTGEDPSDIPNSSVTLSTNMKVGLTGGATELWFDRKGVPRTTDWGINGNTFRVWYDEIANGVIDWTEVGSLDSENKCNEPCRLIIISSEGRIQYEAR